jgi:hypothetical protein
MLGDGAPRVEYAEETVRVKFGDKEVGPEPDEVAEQAHPLRS